MSKTLEHTVSFRATDELWNRLQAETARAGLKSVSEYARRKVDEEPSDSMRSTILRIDARTLTHSAMFNVLFQLAGFNPENEEQMEQLSQLVNQNKIDILEAENGNEEE